MSWISKLFRSNAVAISDENSNDRINFEPHSDRDTSGDSDQGHGDITSELGVVFNSVANNTIDENYTVAVRAPCSDIDTHPELSTVDCIDEDHLTDVEFEDVSNVEDHDCSDNGNRFDSSIRRTAYDKMIYVGAHFSSCEQIKEHVREISSCEGFSTAAHPYLFPANNPHPLHGSDSKVWQRGKIYCNHKEASTKNLKSVKSTCPWHVKFTFDREAIDYVITAVSLMHNHMLDNMEITAGGLREITLDSDLTEAEREFLHEYARYNVPLVKVHIVIRIRCVRVYSV